MKIEKIFAWGLLLFGVLFILWGIYSSFNIFTAKTEPPLVFGTILEKQNFEEPVETIKGTLQAGEEMIEKEIEKQIAKIIPFGFVSKILNLIAWSIFMGILFFGASHLSGIGIKMLKKN